MTKNDTPAAQTQTKAVPEGYVLVPIEPTALMIEAICREHTECNWPKDFDPTAQAIRRRDAREGYKAAVRLAATAPEAIE